MTNVWFENRALFIIMRKIFVVTIFKKFWSFDSFRDNRNNKFTYTYCSYNYAFYYVAIILFVLLFITLLLGITMMEDY